MTTVGRFYASDRDVWDSYDERESSLFAIVDYYLLRHPELLEMWSGAEVIDLIAALEPLSERSPRSRMGPRTLQRVQLVDRLLSRYHWEDIPKELDTIDGYLFLCYRIDESHRPSVRLEKVREFFFTNPDKYLKLFASSHGERENFKLDPSLSFYENSLFTWIRTKIGRIRGKVSRCREEDLTDIEREVLVWLRKNALL